MKFRDELIPVREVNGPRRDVFHFLLRQERDFRKSLIPALVAHAELRDDLEGHERLTVFAAHQIIMGLT